MTFRNILLSLCCFMILNCSDNNHIDKARAKSSAFMENLGSEDAYLSFPDDYFSKSEMKRYFSGFGINCDYENRNGKFVDYYLEAGKDGKRISFIYEYLLKCDSLRFVLKYNLEDEPVLIGFRVEPIEQYNPMIIDRSKSLLPSDGK